jgi:tRNA-dihydrouridine synthase A
MTYASAHRLSVAPMMDWTDRRCRAFHRALTSRTLLYTEMVTAQAVAHGDIEHLLGFDAVEHPVALQLGGSDPALLADTARIGGAMGYDEINLNVGCPSDRVQSGRFGACLMLEPQLVAECVAAMAEATTAPVTVKCRIGVDDQDPETALFGLVEACAATGVKTFAVHARKAWLQGLSPKENRDIPPLDYDIVYRLKRERPDLTIVLNGGVANLDEAQAHLAHVDGVMLGRAAYHDPAGLGSVDRRIFGEAAVDIDGFEAIERYRPYMAAQLAKGAPLNAMTRHMLGLFHGWPGARAWRRILSVEAAAKGSGLEVLDRALDVIREGQDRAAERLTAVG